MGEHVCAHVHAHVQGQGMTVLFWRQFILTKQFVEIHQDPTALCQSALRKLIGECRGKGLITSSSSRVQACRPRPDDVVTQPSTSIQQTLTLH